MTTMTTVVLTVFSKENCSYCKKTKIFLNDLNVDFQEIKLDSNNTNDKDIIDNLKTKYNHHTFPFIIVNHNSPDEVFIGGFSNLENAYNTMYLHKLISLKEDIDF
jgi:glutaredoxin